MKEKNYKQNEFPQKNGNYSLNDYYAALKYRNFDLINSQLASGIILTIEQTKKFGTKPQQGMLKSILSEYLEIFPAWNENHKLQLFVISINIPKDMQSAFLTPEQIKKAAKSSKHYQKERDK